MKNSKNNTIPAKLYILSCCWLIFCLPVTPCLSGKYGIGCSELVSEQFFGVLKIKNASKLGYNYLGLVRLNRLPDSSAGIDPTGLSG